MSFRICLADADRITDPKLPAWPTLLSCMPWWARTLMFCFCVTSSLRCSRYSSRRFRPSKWPLPIIAPMQELVPPVDLASPVFPSSAEMQGLVWAIPACTRPCAGYQVRLARLLSISSLSAGAIVGFRISLTAPSCCIETRSTILPKRRRNWIWRPYSEGI